MGCYGNAARRAGARASGNGCCHAPAVSLNANQLAKGDVCERGLASAPAGVAGMAAFSGCGYELQTICVALYSHCTRCCCLQRICERGLRALMRSFGYARPQVDVVDMSLNRYGPFWEVA